VRRLISAFTGRPTPTPPNLCEGRRDIIRRHGELLSDHFGEDKGMRDCATHRLVYLQGFPRQSIRLSAMPYRLSDPDELDRPL